MSQLLSPAIDLIAIITLVFGLYLPRHRRADMAASFLGVNVGVLAVVEALQSASAGLGLGLFGVLSIIRLRSSDIDHQEVAYYFGALALGVLGGIDVTPRWLPAVLAGAIVLALFVGDHPRLFGRYRFQLVTLDRAYTDEDAMRARLESLLGAKVHLAKVRRVDLVEDTTNVEVRYELPRVPRTRPTDASTNGLAASVLNGGSRR